MAPVAQNPVGHIDPVAHSFVTVVRKLGDE
jgi:hypothetical protein